MAEYEGSANLVQAEEHLRRKSFLGLQRFIEYCLDRNTSLDVEDSQFVTDDPRIILAYARLLESKIPAEPAPSLPPFVPWQQATVLGTNDPDILRETLGRFMSFEEKRRANYARDNWECQMIIATVIERVKTQRRVLAGIYQELGCPQGVAEDQPPKKVSWEILPPGPNPFPRVIEYFEKLALHGTRVEYDLTRLRKINGLHPDETYVGSNEFEGYVVFHFLRASTAVLECPKSGNAIYLIRGDWETLSRYTKSRLLSKHSGKVQRIIHAGDWFSRLRSVIKSSGPKTARDRNQPAPTSRREPPAIARPKETLPKPQLSKPQSREVSINLLYLHRRRQDALKIEKELENLGFRVHLIPVGEDSQTKEHAGRIYYFESAAGNLEMARKIAAAVKETAPLAPQLSNFKEPRMAPYSLWLAR